MDYKRYFYVLFVLIVISSSVAIYSSLRESGSTGITSINKAGLDNLVVALQDRIIVLRPGGSIKEEFVLSKTPISGPVRDIYNLKSGGFIIGDGGSNTIFRCSEYFTSCQNISHSYRPGRFHKFIVDEDRSRIYVSSTSNHELHLLEFDKNVLSKPMSKPLDKVKDLNFPDGLFLKGGYIYLVNAMDQEVIKIEHKKDSFSVVKRFLLKDKANGLSKKLPMSITGYQNKWLVTAQTDDVYAYSSKLYVFDEEFKLEKSLEDNNVIYPTSAIRVDGYAYIVDSIKNAVFKYDIVSNSVTEFGGREFKEIGKQLIDAKSLYVNLKYISVAFTLIFLIVALFLENIRKKNQKDDEDEKNDVDLKVEFNQLYPKVLRFVPVLAVVLLFFAVYLLKDVSSESGALYLYITFLMVVSMTIMMMTNSRMIPKKIEINASQVLVQDQNDDFYHEAVEAIEYTHMAIRLRGKIFVLGNNGAFLKDKSMYDILVERIKHGNKLSNWNMQKHIFKCHPIVNTISYVALIVTFIMMLYVSMFIEDASEDADKANVVSGVM